MHRQSYLPSGVSEDRALPLRGIKTPLLLYVCFLFFSSSYLIFVRKCTSSLSSNPAGNSYTWLCHGFAGLRTGSKHPAGIRTLVLSIVSPVRPLSSSPPTHVVWREVIATSLDRSCMNLLAPLSSR